MPIVPLTFEPTSGLASELKIHDRGQSEKRIRKILKRNPTARHFYEGDLADLEALLCTLPESLKVLDVGFGMGKSTLLLADRGHWVSGLEPSLEACEILNGLAERFGFLISLFQGPAEAAAQIPDKDFDLIVFNSSLHHCDEPEKALASCRGLLRPGGKIFLNEPILKPFRTKAWYARMLKENPVRMGHYGGNEHVYYSWEYVRMLRDAGFSKVTTPASACLANWSREVKRMRTSEVYGERIYSFPRLVAHSSWNAGLTMMGRIPLLRKWLTCASLFPVNFIASNT